VERWARDEGARIAILQVDWFEVHPRIPRNWVWVGDWVMPRNVVFETFRVGFFAVDSAEAPRLTEALRQFSPQVPRGIRQEGPYTE
jgi:hypothetical protein